MVKKLKNTNLGNQILTGNQVVAEIFGHKPQYISDVVNGRSKDKKGILKELELFASYQEAYIKKRKIILGINQ